MQLLVNDALLVSEWSRDKLLFLSCGLANRNMNESTLVALQTVFAVLGCLLAWLLAYSPFPSIKLVRKTQALGSLNIVPFVLMYLFNFAFILYSFVQKDVWILASNIVGMHLGLGYVLVCVPFLGQTEKDQTLVFLSAGSVYLLVSTCLATIYCSPSTQSIWMGWNATVLLCIFYISPFSTLLTIIKTRNASSLHLLLCLTSLVCALSWCIYGLLLQDYFLLGSNGLGLVCGLIQVFLKVWYHPHGVQHLFYSSWSGHAH
ncbi:hypothetical protein HDU91_002685 [Kappamyces sp. JEL0680]|nr:hypothetical protein HDU91_002685 [Kappamyces sp. JEL0680]